MNFSATVFDDSNETASFKSLGIRDFSHLVEGLANLLKSYYLFEDDLFFITDDVFSFYSNEDYIFRATRINPVDLKALISDELCILIPQDLGFYENGKLNSAGCLRINKRTEEISFFIKEEKHKYFINHLTNILHNKTHYLSKEEYQWLRKVNATDKNFPAPHTVDELFDQTCLRFPDQIAVVDDGNEISYKALNDLSQKISSFLIGKLGNKKNGIIAIGMSKSIALIAGFFGIIRTGSAYVPLTLTYPTERIKELIDEAEPAIVLCDKVFYQEHKEALKGLELLMAEDILNLSLTTSVKKISSVNDPEDPLYIIYTSGSTDRSKGVMICHKSIVNMSYTAAELCSIKPKTRVLCCAHIGFDASVWEIYGALLNGATLHFPKDGIQAKIENLVDYLLTHKINMATLTPGVLALLSDANYFKDLQTLIIVGDRCQKSIMNEWAIGRKIINAYGPTEASVGTSAAIYDSTKSEVCIGKPFYNYQVHILDEEARPVGIGFIGEIWISGIGVARGYLKNENLTNKKFKELQLPYMDKPARAFRTSDMACWNPNGELEFLGRDEDQLKIKGARIETNIIENIINEYPNVKRSAVVPMGQKDNITLIAYVILKTKVDINVPEFELLLIKYISEFVHPLMIPKHVIIVENFQLTRNGKVNRSALPKPVVAEAVN